MLSLGKQYAVVFGPTFHSFHRLWLDSLACLAYNISFWQSSFLWLAIHKASDNPTTNAVEWFEEWMDNKSV